MGVLCWWGGGKDTEFAGEGNVFWSERVDELGGEEMVIGVTGGCLFGSTLVFGGKGRDVSCKILEILWGGVLLPFLL